MRRRLQLEHACGRAVRPLCEEDLGLALFKPRLHLVLLLFQSAYPRIMNANLAPEPVFPEWQHSP